MPRFLPRALYRQRRPACSGIAEHQPVKLLHIGTAMALTLIAACALAALLLGGALAWLGLPETTGKQYGLKTLLDIIKISLAVVGGIGGAVALVVAYRKQRLAEEENHRAREENERARQAARREDTKLYAERFDKAGDKLGAESAAVRLAGVHALAALADDWDGGRQMCIDVLCAYLRMPHASEPDALANSAAHATWTALREVRATIVRLIATHLRADAPVPWHGADLDFTGVDFSDGANFANTVFSGGVVRFINAKFSGGDVSFNGAEFSGGAVWFDGAEFSGGAVRFDGAEFSGGAVRFIKAEFVGGEVWFDGAEFVGGEVSFTNAKFSGGAVWFDGAEFVGGAVLFNGAEFVGGAVLFNGAKFSGGAVRFNSAKFARGAVWFDDAEFVGGEVSFTNAKFSGGAVDFAEVTDWSRPPNGLPASAPGLKLPTSPTVPEPAD